MLILGAGAFGRALYKKAELTSCKPLIWSRQKKETDSLLQTNGDHFYNLEKALTCARALVYVLPAQVFRSFFQKIKAHLDPHIPILVAAKGIEQTTGFFFDQIMLELDLPNPLVVLSGPHLAKELEQNSPTLGLISGHKDAAFFFREKFQGSNFILDIHHNIHAAMMVNAFKNVLALLGGIIRGEGGSQNILSSFLGLGFKEMCVLSEKENIKEEDLTHPALLGDLMLTTHSLDSRNTKMGIAIAKGQTCHDFLAEGLLNLEGFLIRAHQFSVNLPLCKALEQRLHHYGSLCTQLDTLTKNYFS